MSKATEFDQHITVQLKRIAHMPGFPETTEAVRDYKAALAAAGTQQAVTRLMDEIVATDWDRVCSAARIREMAWEANSKHAAAIFGCAECDWTGWKRVERGGLSGVRECECRSR